ncbi:MAG: hydantoinase/oxoprolinase family protein [Dethiobacter sp.]|jgi:N-methylhydantoinase A/acetophenone carboxylase|nr:MAG: hydantoinase/oxoprolinase family protein [Dethiobacter sp.]
MYTIDVDTGGTFTDGFFTKDGDYWTVKVLTTPHDLTVCLAECIKEGSKQFGLSVEEMLVKADVVRYSTTVSVNTLITRTGSKIGLLISKGYKETLYAKDRKEKEPLYSLISQEMIQEIDEEIDSQGNIIKPLNKAEVIEKVQYLIDMGVRSIAVSMKNSYINPAHEKEVKAIIKSQYPEHYLGRVRVFLASEISDQPGDFPRTNAVVINGYIHDSLVNYLYKAEEDLRNNFYRYPLMVAHSHGGVRRVAKTRAIDTYSSGPVLGLIGAKSLALLYDYRNVLTVDIGGTSLDIGYIYNGEYNYSFQPKIIDLPVSIPMITTYSAPIASNSIARLNAGKNLHIGPQSAGSKPGPACFDFGGLEPTVTDADVVLGYIDPDYFLDGRIKLNKAKAVSAIKSRIATPLGIFEEEAAFMIREEAGRKIRKEIIAYLKSQGTEPDDLKNFAFVVYGGGGPTHCCDFVKELPFGLSIMSPYASVFSAFGSSATDLLHNYSKFLKVTLYDGKAYFSDYDWFNGIVNQLLESAKKDIRGEGFLPDEALYFLEITGGEKLEGIKIKTDKLFLKSEGDVKELCTMLSANSVGKDEIEISNISVIALVKMPHMEFKAKSLTGSDPGKALKGYREVFWSLNTGYKKTPIYQRELLESGNIIVGPAIVEAKDTTYVVPENMSLEIDKYTNAIIKEV